MGGCCASGGTNSGPVVRVLIVGLAGCGKSTLLKQFTFLNTGAYANAVEVEELRMIANTNLLVGMKDLLKLAEMNKLVLSEINLKHERYIKELVEVDNVPLLHEKLKELWNDKVIVNIWNRSSTLPIQIKMMDYLMNHIDRYNPEMHEEFVPSDDDILLLRQRTTGVVSIRFKSTEKFDWEFIDVGGQRPERMKWKEVVDSGVEAILYMVALDECVISCVEDNNYKSNLLYSKKVFEEFIEMTPKAKNIPKIVFLNKQDLYTKAFQNTPDLWDLFTTFYPDYVPVTPPSLDHALNFLGDLFKITKDISIWNGTCLNREFTSQLYKELATIILETKLQKDGLLDIDY